MWRGVISTCGRSPWRGSSGRTFLYHRRRGTARVAARIMDGRSTVLTVVGEMGYAANLSVGLRKIRRLVARGAVDLTKANGPPRTG